METVTDFIFLGSKISVMVTAARKLKDAFSLEGKLNKPRQCIKKQTLFCQQSLYSQSYGFSSSHVWIWELDHKEGWALSNWCFWIVVLEKTLESPLDSKEIKPVHPLENQPWIFIGRTDFEAEVPILWPPDAKSRLTGKDSDARKDWGEWEKEVTEDEMVGWHHRDNGYEFDQTPGDRKDRGAWCAAVYGIAKSQIWQQLNNNNIPDWSHMLPGEG